MNGRKQILETIRGSKPSAVDLPAIPHFNSLNDTDLLTQFIRAATATGSEVINDFDIRTWDAWFEEKYAPRKKTFLHSRLVPVSNIGEFSDVKHFNDVEVTVLDAILGVSENGAVWLDEKHCGFRIAPFITEHLVVFLHKNLIVPDMHHAYANLDLKTVGYGVFIGGPSKTADIEQSLVTGAQGARTHTIILV